MARQLNDYPDISVSLEDLSGAIDFARIFGRSGLVQYSAKSRVLHHKIESSI